MKKLITIAAILVAFTSSIASADDASVMQADTLLNLMGMKAAAEQGIDRIISMQLQQNPSMMPYKPVMMKFFQKYMSWESMQPDLVKLYSETFNSQELSELIDFYKTGTGQKILKVYPDLISAGAKMAESRIQEHLPELQGMIQAESKRLQELSGQ